MTSPTNRPSLLTPRFVTLCLGVTLYFLGLNMTLSVLPLFVEGELGGTDAQVGIAVSSFGLAAACIRPIIGPLATAMGDGAWSSSGRSWPGWRPSPPPRPPPWPP